MVENLDPRSQRVRWPMILTALGMLLVAITFTIDLELVGLLSIPFFLGMALIVVGSLATGLSLREEASDDLFGRALAIAIVVPTALLAILSGSLLGEASEQLIFLIGVGFALLGYALVLLFAHGVHAAVFPDRRPYLVWLALVVPILAFLREPYDFGGVLGIATPGYLLAIAMAKVASSDKLETKRG